jgi:hypothetical protein
MLRPAPPSHVRDQVVRRMWVIGEEFLDPQKSFFFVRDIVGVFRD